MNEGETIAERGLCEAGFLPGLVLLSSSYILSTSVSEMMEKEVTVIV